MAKIKDKTAIYNSDGKPEIIVVNIQKFKEDHTPVSIIDPYSTNLQRVFFIDEAHRGYNPKGSFLANLLEADKDAIKVAMTGTPLLNEEKASWKVFGDYIHVYYYNKSIEDGYTLKLMREDIETEYKEKISDILAKLTEGVTVKKKSIDRNKIIEHPNYLNALLDYIFMDMRKFRIQNNTPEVAGMIVCETNEQARELHRLFEKRNQKEELPEGVAPLKSVLILHDEGDKITRKDWINEFKKTEAIDFVIVNKMLLTGFDAPRLKRLYLCRKLDGHDLLQALTRVNRPYRDFRYGYVVDFADIKENFVETNNRYLDELKKAIYGSGYGGGEDEESSASVLLVSPREIEEKLCNLKNILFSWTVENKEEFRKQLDEEKDKEKLYALRRSLDEAKAIINQVRSFGDEELKTMVKKLAPGEIPVLLSEVNNRIERINLLENVNNSVGVTQIINEALAQMEFKFVRKGKEELTFFYNQTQEYYTKIRREFESNFDTKDEKYVNLLEEFKKEFRKRGYVPSTVAEAKEAIGYMESVLKRIKDINKHNNALKHKYHGNEFMVRAHKRIVEENAKRDKTLQPPIISKEEYKIMEGLNSIKAAIDVDLYNNIRILENEESFRQDVLRMVGEKLYEMNIKADRADRNFITRQIVNEYCEHYRRD